MGYDSGQELVIGRYQKGTFVQNLLDGDAHW